jgi:hypothetical protein
MSALRSPRSSKHFAFPPLQFDACIIPLNNYLSIIFYGLPWRHDPKCPTGRLESRFLNGITNARILSSSNNLDNTDLFSGPPVEIVRKAYLLLSKALSDRVSDEVGSIQFSMKAFSKYPDITTCRNGKGQSCSLDTHSEVLS